MNARQHDASRREVAVAALDEDVSQRSRPERKKSLFLQGDVKRAFKGAFDGGADEAIFEVENERGHLKIVGRKRLDGNVEIEEPNALTKQKEGEERWLKDED